MIYPIVSTYVKDWTTLDAVRELIANAVDTKKYYISTPTPDTLVITSTAGKIQRRSLLLGASDKETGAIGQFGEGLKLAMLVLARNNIDVTMYNYDELWSFSLDHNEDFDEDLLVHTSTPLEVPTDCVRIVISGIDTDTVAANTLQLRTWDGYKTPEGTIIEHDAAGQGRIYLGGLFVCDTECVHSYNFEVGQLDMNRDRSMVSNFDLTWQLRDLWACANRPEELRRLLLADAMDTRGFEHRPIQIAPGPGEVRGRAYLACTTAPTVPLEARMAQFFKLNKSRMTPLARKRFKEALCG